MDDVTKAAIADEVKSQLTINGKVLQISSFGDAAWGAVCMYIGYSVAKYGWSTIKSTLK